MIWLWIVAGCVLYLLIGFAVTAFICGYYDEDFESNWIFIPLWLLLIICNVLCIIFVKPYESIRRLGEKLRKRKGD